MPIPTTPLPLPYQRRRHRLRQWKLAVVPIAIAVAIFLAWHGGYARYVRSWYWQRQCMQFGYPPDALICDYDPNWSGSAPILATPMSAPDCWQHLQSGIVSRSASGLAIDYWNDQATILCDVPAFLHARMSRSGHTRLVVAQLAEQTKNGKRYDVMLARVIAPGSPVRLACCTREFSTYLAVGVPVRVFAGSPDPHDPSHFSIRCQRNGWPIVVDGWLQGDDTVRWQITGDGD